MRQTRTPWRVALLVPALAAALLLGACASDGGGEKSPGDGSHVGAALGGSEGGYEGPGEAVRDNVRVTWRNLDDRNPDVTQSLVNASSEMGRQLRSGRTSSTSTRVLADTDMGTLIEELDDVGFFDEAKSGLSLQNVPDLPGARGVVVVERNGRAQGLLMTTGLSGTRVPETYVKSKQLIFSVHSAVQGYEVRVNVDEDRVFQAPRARLRR